MERQQTMSSESSIPAPRSQKRSRFHSSYWALYGIIDDSQSRCLLALGLLTAIAAGVPLPLIAVVFKGIVETFPPQEAALEQAVLQIVGISVAYFVVTFIWSVAWGELGRRICQKLQSRLVGKVLGFDQAFFDLDSFDITSMLVSDTQTIQRGTSEKVGLFVQSCSYFVATFVTGFVLNAALTGVLFAAIVPAILLITWTGSSLISRYSVRASSLTDKAAAIAEGAIRCVLVVQAFGVADTLSNKHAELLKSATRFAIRKVIVAAFMLAVVIWACYSLNALAFYWGSRLGGSSGTIYAVVFLILDASFVFNQVGPFVQTIALAAGASEKVFAVLNRAHSDIQVYSRGGTQLSYHNVCGDIIFDNVDFCYPVRSSTRVLDSLNLCIPGGKSTAIVGLSGSGKSTLTSLILRLYDPGSGMIRIGDSNLQLVNLPTFRSHIAVVQQNPVIFSGSILENIRCGIIDPDDLEESEMRTRCQQAADDAHCDFIDKLEKGIDTVVSSSEGLSGGQRQRICLARALVRRPALLILDEPTSALDSWSERKIEECLKKVIEEKDTTVITIAHRLATIKEYSKIVVMGGGQVLEQGTHEELLAKGIHYKALVEAQQLTQSAEAHPYASDFEHGESSGSTTLNNTPGSSLEKIASHPQYEQPKRPKINNYRIMRNCFRFLQPERGLLLVGIVASILQGCVIIGEAFVFGHMVTILNTDSDRATLYSRIDFLSLMFFAISLAAFSSTALSGICFGFVSEAFVLRMRDILLRTILRQDQSWFQAPSHTTTQLMAGINQNSNSLAAISGPIIQTLFATSAMIISGIAVGLASTPLIALVSLSYIPAILLSGYVRVKMLSLFDERYSTANRNAAAIACEAVHNIQTVAAFGLEGEVHKKYNDALQTSYWRNFIVMTIGNLALSFSYSVIYFLYPLLYWWGSKEVREGVYSQQAFFISLPAIVIASQQSGQFFTMAPEVVSSRHAARHVFELLQNKASISMDVTTGKSHDCVLGQGSNVFEPIVPLSITAGHDKTPHQANNNENNSVLIDRHEKSLGGADIEFRNVTFSYPTRPDAKILQNIDFHIQSGQFVAFVGPSGAGKSSLIAMLERFFDPTSGKVFVNGNNIRSQSIEVHRSQIGLVPQEPELFAGTISFNIALGARTGQMVNQGQIEEVCQACGIHEFISSLPNGYDTECGAQGSQLSGGQKQRIAVARALVRDPQILLLDEATASLDSQSEKDIQQAISAASAHRTTVMVAHRLSTIQHANCIFVFDDGILVDRGTHAELMQKDGIYSSMARAQSLG